MFIKTFQAGWGDMDYNGHMRNTAYLDYMCASDSEKKYIEMLNSIYYNNLPQIHCHYYGDRFIDA